MSGVFPHDVYMATGLTLAQASPPPILKLCPARCGTA